jgi:hypothetical protein
VAGDERSVVGDEAGMVLTPPIRAQERSRRLARRT